MQRHNNYTGLSKAQVEESRRLHGVNILTPPKRKSAFLLFLEKFKDPLIIILLIAGVLSVGISFYEYYYLESEASVFFEPIGIFVAIFLATGLGFIFEHKAEKEFAVLNQVNDEEPTQVVREGNRLMIPRRDVVVGDIVVISTGIEVPADCQLLESTNLNIDESSLTGEPLCHKSANPDDADPEATFPTDMVMRGTKVMEGHGIAEVKAVGDHTENGKVFEAAQIDNSVKTPLSIQLDKVGKFVSVASYIIGVLVIVGRIATYFVESAGDFNLMEFLTYTLQSVMLAVTLVVVAVPEGLPMAVTLSLAYSMRRMLKTNNLVRKMHACETMGAVTVICTDKTGTLTCNRMQVADIKYFGNADNSLPDNLKINIALNSTSGLDLTDKANAKAIGNPTEGALLLWLWSQGVDYRQLRSEYHTVRELPFTTENKYMATIVANRDGQKYLLVKGAPEIVAAMSANSAEVEPVLAPTLADYQNHAMRTLGFAWAKVDTVDAITRHGVDCDTLRMNAVAAISDPVREDVADAIAKCRQAGIAIKIITGDTPATTKEIARQIGLWTDDDNDNNIALGETIAAMSDEQLRQHIGDIKIIARARPMDKKRIVEALQANGEVVAVTGDGTNDAPALNAAHVGLSMGDGTSVAKEASDITIIDNSFVSIGRAVMWGRSLYKNIQRFLLFQLTVNLAACLTVMVGSFMGTAVPLTVTQMLWVNLIMDTFAAMALSTLPASEDVMNDSPRRRDAFILTKPIIMAISCVGLLFAATMIFMLYRLEHLNITAMTQIFEKQSATYLGLNVYEESLFFTIFVMLQFWNLFNAKKFDSDRRLFSWKGCGEFWMIAAIILVGQILIVTFGGTMFNATPLSIADWAAILVTTSPVLLLAGIFNPRSK